MVFPMVLKLAEWLVYQLLANSFYRAAMKVKSYGFIFRNPTLKLSPQLPLFPNLSKCTLEGRASQTLVCDINGSLLRTQTFFPFFMLVAFEGGSIFRAFLLLLSTPFLWFLDPETKLRVMIFISFCGLRVKDMETVGRAVLPKFYLENLNPQAYELWASAGTKVVITCVPKVMVQGFLKEYMEVDRIVGTELETFGHYFTGLVSNSSGLLVKHRALKDLFGERKPDIGIGTSSFSDYLFLSIFKEGYVVSATNQTATMPRSKYPKPLVFHDGRLAFLPTPLATLAMFIWLPLGILLAVFRLLVGIYLPYQLAILLGTLSGVNLRVKGEEQIPTKNLRNGKGVLFVCTHRTLLDPVFLSTLLGKPLTAVTYSLSKVSELISPIRTVRLTRDRKQDGETMNTLLSEGDLVVCPEGTTCREPYLLRFSSLFAELADEIVPVAINTEVTMFYGTTAGGLKCLDPIFFLMNPRPSYHVQVLGKVPRELTCAGGRSGHEVANMIQRQLGEALGFECTGLTRRDKYLMLAGNEGVVQDKRKKEH